MYTILLKEEYMMKESHFPIIAHINEAYNNNIMDFIDCMIRGIGVGYNYTCSSFWNELDDFDKENTPEYDGLLIETEADERVILSIPELLHYLELTGKCLSDISSPHTDDFEEKIGKFKIAYKGKLN